MSNVVVENKRILNPGMFLIQFRAIITQSILSKILTKSSLVSWKSDLCSDAIILLLYVISTTYQWVRAGKT